MPYIDFSSQQARLFTGRKSGEVARVLLLKEDGQQAHIYILARPDQFITSSFFIGLLYDNMWLFDKESDLIGAIKADGLTETSHGELKKAIARVRRGLI